MVKSLQAPTVIVPVYTHASCPGVVPPLHTVGAVGQAGVMICGDPAAKLREYDILPQVGDCTCTLAVLPNAIPEQSLNKVSDTL